MAGANSGGMHPEMDHRGGDSKKPGPQCRWRFSLSVITDGGCLPSQPRERNTVIAKKTQTVPTAHPWPPTHATGISCIYTYIIGHKQKAPTTHILASRGRGDTMPNRSHPVAASHESGALKEFESVAFYESPAGDAPPGLARFNHMYGPNRSGKTAPGRVSRSLGLQEAPDGGVLISIGRPNDMRGGDGIHGAGIPARVFDNDFAGDNAFSIDEDGGHATSHHCANGRRGERDLLEEKRRSLRGGPRRGTATAKPPPLTWGRVWTNTVWRAAKPSGKF